MLHILTVVSLVCAPWLEYASRAGWLLRRLHALVCDS